MADAAGGKSLNELGRTFIGQLAEIVTGGDETVRAATNSFVSWCAPGIPFSEEDFAFAAKGLGAGATAEEEKLLTQQASDFSRLVDFVPDPTVVYNNDKQQTIFTTSEARLSHMYSEILRAAKVVKTELTPAEEAKLEKFRKALRTTRKVKDIITDEEKEITEDGPFLKAYNEKMAQYITAALVYNSKRVAAMSATGADGKAAVIDFRTNAQLYRLQVKAAEDAWVSGGFRNEVDKMNAFIDQVGQRDMFLWLQRLKEMNNDALLTDNSNSRFAYTGLIPGNFAKSAGWTNFKTTHTDVFTQDHSTSSSWKVGAGMSFGFGSFGGNASGSKSKTTADKKVNTFTMTFELAQVVVSRPWFYPEFFMNRGWTLQKGNGWFFDDMPSDGAATPKGVFVGYPTTILFARKIEIVSDEFASAYREEKSSLSAGASLGWGPVRLSGSYSRNTSDAKFESNADGNVVSVPGMQIIGFINHMISKSPNPLPEIKPEEFQ